MINRDDMLELTRRMTVKRNCFSRIVGAYYDNEGYVDGTFNTHFLKLTESEREKNLKLCKAIPFSETNVELKEIKIPDSALRPGSTVHFLKNAIDTEFKNDAIFDAFYDYFGENFKLPRDYALYFFLGNYDIPLKGSDKVEQWESEEVFRFLVAVICPVDKDYEPADPVCGFMYPAYKNRGAYENLINIYNADKYPEIMKILGV